MDLGDLRPIRERLPGLEACGPGCGHVALQWQQGRLGARGYGLKPEADGVCATTRLRSTTSSDVAAELQVDSVEGMAS